MLFAKVGTDKTVSFGPVLAADGTMSSGALAYTDAKIFKNGTDGALNASATFTHKYEGVYALLLKAADLDAVGCYEVVLNKNPLSASPVKITVLAANVYDWLFGTVAPSTLTQTNISGGAYDLTNATYVAALKAALGTIPAQLIDGAHGGAAASLNLAGGTALGAVTQTGLATSAELAKVPKSDGAVSWNATALAAINAEVDSALNTAIPGSPTADSINERVATMDDLTADATSGLAKIATDVAAVLVDTGTTLDTLVKDIPTNAELTVAIAAGWTTAIAQSYGTDGSELTPAQCLYLILGNVSGFAISGVTKTVKKLDGLATAATYTLDSATAPTAITRTG